MAVKLIALDLDGTALRGHRRMSDRTRKVVLEALDAGILVVPSTGRSYRDIPREVRELPVPYFLTSNGASVLGDGGRTAVYSDLIPWQQSVRILRLLETYEVQPSVHMDGASTNLRTADPRVAARYGNTDYFTRHSVENLADYVESRRRGVEKIFAIFFDRQVGDELAKRVQAFGEVTVTASGRDNIEVNSPTASKGRALEILCGRLGFRSSETAVIGDSRNDLSMFRSAGLKIAMGNAEPSLAELADHITGSCEEDGAAMAIEQILSGRW